MKVLLLALLVSGTAWAEILQSENPVTQFEEQRYCGAPDRDANGVIKRSLSAKVAFIRAHPCPVTGKTFGACSGWSIDHVIPLACGGCDAVSNMQWLPNYLKSSKTGKDRFERLIYCTPMRKVKESK